MPCSPSVRQEACCNLRGLLPASSREVEDSASQKVLGCSVKEANLKGCTPPCDSNYMTSCQRRNCRDSESVASREGVAEHRGF